MANRAAYDFAENIAAAFIGRKDAICDEKCDSTSVIGDDAEGSRTTSSFFKEELPPETNTA